MRSIPVVTLVLLLSASLAVASPIVTTGGYIAAAPSGGAPVFGVTGVPNYSLVAQDQQYNKDTFWDGVYPDKNHNVASFTNLSLTDAPDFSTYGTGKVEAENIAKGLVSDALITGNYEIGDFQAGFTEDGITYPGGTPVWFYGDGGGSKLVLDNVANNFAVQFFSDDKNDGYVELWVNGQPIASYDTWCQGFWYMEVNGLNPNVANTVELRTSSTPGPHLNTLNLNPSSENYQMKLPGDPGYPEPMDFHVDYVAYTPFETPPVPEPASCLLLLSGSAILGWMHRRRKQN